MSMVLILSVSPYPFNRYLLDAKNRKKKVIKVTKNLVEKSASAPLRPTVAKILDSSPEIELGDLKALRPFVYESDVITLRARL